MDQNRDLPRPEDLLNYNYAVAGHAGTLCDVDGELFIKPCTQAEIEFYQSANRRYPDFAQLMPSFMGTLTLTDPLNDGIDATVAGLISETGPLKTTSDQIIETVTEQIANATGHAKGANDKSWEPTRGKKIRTDKAVALENATHGFKRANILDVKLGVRLWADDAPPEKKERFDKISAETTHGSLGFRIAGMRVFRGSADASDLDAEEYRVYDKDYGRISVTKENVAGEFRRFIFNSTAGIDEHLGKAVCQAFARDLAKVREVMAEHESRMFSTSLLFVFEGDGEALRKAIETNNLLADEVNRMSSYSRTTKRTDSGIVLAEEDFDEDELEELQARSLSRIYSLKLIDFAHAAWTPGQGPDENTLIGVRNLERIFNDMAQ